MGLKRTRSAEFICHNDEPDMHILVAGGGLPLKAHYQLLRQCATCVRDLPRTADTTVPVVWDLQALVLEEENIPVSAEVVQCWLDFVYARLDAGRRVPRIKDLDEARPLLAFADACGTCRVILDDIGRRLTDNPDLGMNITVGEGPQRMTVKLALRDTVYYPSGAGLNRLHGGRREVVIDTNAYAPHGRAFPSAVCSALESWLHLAGRLGMVPLCRALVDFIKAQLVLGTLSLVFSAFSSTFSRRVLECMPRELLYEALVRDTLLLRPAEVQLEAEEVNVTLGTELAATYYSKPVGTAESMELSGGLLRHGSCKGRATLILGGPPPGTAPAIIRQVCTKAFEEAE